jgi:hypothetical protein
MAMNRALDTLRLSHHRLDDGREVAVRRAVPSDAPALSLLDADVDCVGGLVALDDHGDIVGHTGLASGVAVVDGWSESGLAAVLARES